MSNDTPSDLERAHVPPEDWLRVTRQLAYEARRQGLLRDQDAEPTLLGMYLGLPTSVVILAVERRNGQAPSASSTEPERHSLVADATTPILRELLTLVEKEHPDKDIFVLVNRRDSKDD